MRPTRKAIPLALVALGLAAVAGRQTSTPGGFTELHRVDIADASDLELVMGIIERSGESESPKHYHPGGEFGFILEGAATLATEGKPQTFLKAGDSFHQPAGEWHVVSTASEGARTLVFRVLEKGQPMIVEID
jgi:quercetin dioxygenase-like cupin family protein